jgi:uncharacterized protein YodC (DUF2158 family)
MAGRDIESGCIHVCTILCVREPNAPSSIEMLCSEKSGSERFTNSDCKWSHVFGSYTCAWMCCVGMKYASDEPTEVQVHVANYGEL